MNNILGIIGGMGAYAGSNIFDKILHFSNARKDQDFLEIIIHNNSKIPDRTESIIHNGESPLNELKRSIEILENGGANYILIGCITAHAFINELRSYTKKAKILDVVSDTTKYITQNYYGISTIGIICSRGLREVKLWGKTLEGTNINIIYLSDEDQKEFFDETIYGDHGIKAGYRTSDNTYRINKAIDILKARGAELVLGSCSELGIVKNSDSEKQYIDVIELEIHNILNSIY